MATGKITKTSVSGLRTPIHGRSFLWDNRVFGFGVFATPRGHKSYVLQYRIGGREALTRRYTIGRHGSPWTPESARKRAIQLLVDVHRGIDPLQAEQAAKQAIQIDEKLKVSNYVPLYLEQHVLKKNLRSAHEIRRTLENHVIPVFGERSLASLSKREIIAHIELLGERSTAAALKTFCHLRNMLNFAQRRDDISSSPMEGLEPPKGYAPRTRALWDWELQRAWEAAHDLGGAEGKIITLLILTGQRENEVVGMTWAELDFEKRQWVIPKERTKNKRAHLVPLSSAVVTFFENHFPEAERTGFVFSNSKSKKMSGFGNIKGYYDLNIARRMTLANEVHKNQKQNIDPFTFHDLRRSVATGLQRLGVPIEVTEAILNHVSGSRSPLVDTYQVYRYGEEKAEALGKWSDHLRDLFSRSDAWPGGIQLPQIGGPRQTRIRREPKKS